MKIATQHSVTRYFELPFNEEELKAWAATQAQELAGPASFALLFCSPECRHHAEEIMEVVRIYAQVSVIIGCSANGLIATEGEMENEAGFTIALYHLPQSYIHSCQIPSSCLQAETHASDIDKILGDKAEQMNAWMLFASSESIGHDSWLPGWDEATGGSVTVGGFAGGTSVGHESQLYLNGQCFDEGAVALGIGGNTTIEPLISQGCRPIGSPWIVTEAEHNIIHKIGNRPILEVLRDTLEEMSKQEQKQAQGNVFIGLVMDEYKPSFGTGDFLVRNLAAIDPQTGAVAIATPLQVGQNLQFQIRDGQTASIDFETLLRQKVEQIGTRKLYGACLCNCIGRGSALYGVPNHDLNTLHQILPDLPVAGLFCNGEFGPAKRQTRLHGYAASLGLFVDKS